MKGPEVRPDGTVKVLDFGLAGAMEPSAVGLGFSPADPAEDLAYASLNPRLLFRLRW
jgi:hypothetical protein